MGPARIFCGSGDGGAPASAIDFSDLSDGNNSLDRPAHLRHRLRVEIAPLQL